MRDAEWTTATTSAEGKVELATGVEAVTGIDMVRAVTPDALTDRLAEPGAIGETTPAAGLFTTLSTTSDITIGSGGDPADSGTIRLKNADSIVWEAAPTGADIIGILVDSDEAVQIGSADATAVEVTTDSTGTAEVVLPAGSIDGTEILDDTIDSSEYVDGSIDSVHLNSISESTVLAEPDQLQPISDAWLIKYFPAETYPSGVVIDALHITSSATCTDVLNFEEWAQDGTVSSSTVEAITLSGTFTEDDGTLADSAIAADGRLMVDLDATPDDIGFLEITVIFHAN